MALGITGSMTEVAAPVESADDSAAAIALASLLFLFRRVVRPGGAVGTVQRRAEPCETVAAVFGRQATDAAGRFNEAISAC